MPPIAPIPVTAQGWPYMPDNQPIADAPEYSRNLAAALTGFTPGSGTAVGDTGWMAITPAAGCTAGTGTDAPAVRVVANVAHYKGTITATLTTTGSTTIGYVPAAARPPANDGRSMRTGTTGAGAILPYLAVWNSGEIAAKGSLAGSQIILLGGLNTYRTD